MRDYINRGRIILQQGRMAVRDCPAHMAADIDFPENVEEDESDCYRILLNYLAGSNTENRAVALRAPVEHVEEGDDWELTQRTPRNGSDNRVSMRFDFAEGASIGVFPQPDDPRVHLWTVPAARLATIWFAGPPSSERVAKNVSELETFISLNGVTPVCRRPDRAVKASRRGPFGLVTELAIPVAEWPSAGPARRFQPGLRRAGPAVHANRVTTP